MKKGARKGAKLLLFGLTISLCFVQCNFPFDDLDIDLDMGDVWPRADEPVEQQQTAESDCEQWLIDHGVEFHPTTYTPQSPDGHPELTCEIEEPVRLHSPVLGVEFCADDDRCPPMLVACPMAQAIVRMSEELARYDIVTVDHAGTVSCRTISGTDRLSQHALGLAIDIQELVDTRGRDYSVHHDWEQGTDNPTTQKGRVLYDLVHTLHDQRIFNVILTPEYNSAHRNHFHMDLSEGSHFLRCRDDGGCEDGATYLGPNLTGD